MHFGVQALILCCCWICSNTANGLFVHSAPLKLRQGSCLSKLCAVAKAGEPQMQVTTVDGLLAELQGKRAQGDGRSFLALDIDETLASTGEHWLSQMQLLFGNPEGLTPAEMFSKYKLCQNVPYYRENPAALHWMKERRACAETQKHIPPIHGAIECSNAIETRVGVAVAAYITVRPASLAHGTAEWLTSRGFPPAFVVAKPDEVPFEEGNAWKASVLSTCYPHIGGIVDDNPSVLLSGTAPYPGLFFLFGHTHTEAAAILDRLREREHAWATSAAAAAAAAAAGTPSLPAGGGAGESAAAAAAAGAVMAAAAAAEAAIARVEVCPSWSDVLEALRLRREHFLPAP